MTMDDALLALSAPATELPRAAMRWSLDHWAEAGPRFIEVLDRYVHGADRSKDAENALFFALHMMAQKAERAAFPLLCRLLLESQAAETVLGEAITEHLSSILISTFDGGLAGLQGVVEAENVDVFIRSAALNAAAYLTRIGQVTEAQMRMLLGRLIDAVQMDENEILAASWVNAVSSLGYADLTPQVKRLFKNNVMLTAVMEYDDFEEDLEATQYDPEGTVGFAREGIGRLTDAIGIFAHWSFGSAVNETAEGSPSWDWRAAADSGAPRTVTNPLRGVGRNDPCPCGSGKKYKKCCLV